MDYNRIFQVLKYGWKHSKEASQNLAKESTIKRIMIFLDILLCYNKYRMWSNQYLKERFYELSEKQRNSIGERYSIAGKIRDDWQKDFRETKKFLQKYTSKKYEINKYRDKRKKAYTKKFGTGINLDVEYDVNISRQHYLNGTIKIGDNVLLAKHVFIDYSGNVTIEDNVRITNGVIIESHYHAFHSDFKEPRNKVVATDLLICEGAVIGSRAIIMPTCKRIGKHARVGAGAVVTKDVPDYAIVVGVPARVVRIQSL